MRGSSPRKSKVAAVGEGAGDVESRRYVNFFIVKSICAEIDRESKISEARLRRYLIRGLKKEYGPFVTSGGRKSLLWKSCRISFPIKKPWPKKWNFESDALLFSKEKANRKNSYSRNKKKEDDSNEDKSTNAEKGG